jgi:plasmid stability protein
MISGVAGGRTVSKQTLIVPVPDRLLARLRDRARKANRTVEAEVVDLLSAALSANNGVSAKVANIGRGQKPKGRAKPNQHNVATEGDDDELPPDIAEAIAGIPLLDDAGLRRVAEAVLTRKESNRLAALNYKAQAGGLTGAEEQERDMLLHRYEKAMVVRATALGELHKRGVDISDLIAP